MLKLRHLAVLAVLFAALWPAHILAQDTGPAIGSEAVPPPLEQSIIDSQLNDGVRRVLIVGDQLAGGMGAGLTRMTEEDDSVEVVNRFNETSGLTRPEIYDWAAAIPKMAEGKDFNTAIVLIGLNDRRDMRDGDKVLSFNSPEWVALYKKRIDAVIDALQAQKMQVLWMSEPSLGDAALDADMQTLSTYFKERVEAKGGKFIDIRTPFLSADGKYTDRGPDDTGADRRLRESDGVTFFKVGNNRLGQIALAALNSTTTPADQPTAPDANQPLPNVDAAPVQNPTAVPPADTGPVIGQQGTDDVAIVQPTSQVAVQTQGDQPSARAPVQHTLGIAAAQGSQAEALYTTGLTAAPPAGRFDDFSVPATP